MKFVVQFSSGETGIVEADDARVGRSGALSFHWTRNAFEIYTEGLIKCFAPGQWRSYEPLPETQEGSKT